MNKSWNSFIQIALYLSLISRKTLLTQNQFDEKMEKNSLSYTTKILREMNVQHYTVWKNEKFSLTEKKFRQINYLVISLVKPLLSRNFCKESVRENFCNFHTVH